MEALFDRYSAVEENLRDIRASIERAARSAGRSPDEILLLAATKTVPAEVINHAISLGVTCIGENRVQEFLEKYDSVRHEEVQCHFIGHLQTNKVAAIIDKVSMIHSVDRLRLAEEIDRQSEKAHKVMDVLVEVNIGGEESKSGVSPDEAEVLIREMAGLPHIRIRGLMCIPPFSDDMEQTDGYFFKMRKLFIDITGKKIDNVSMDILSMGMSDDYEQAICKGAGIVRIGSALFGRRQ